MPSHFHETAIVDAKAQLGERVQVGPYAIIEAGAVLGDDCALEAHSIVKGSARLGNGVVVGHFSVIGGNPQHLSFNPDTPSTIEIGSGVRFGEGVTAHRSMYENGKTIIRENSFLMGNAHVAHDCALGREVVLANGALLGGHVTLCNHVFIGGGAGVHQFVRVGEGVMVGGLGEISKDVAPQVLAMGRNRTCGLNMVGLKRRNVSEPEISELKNLYRAFLMKPGNLSKRADEFLGSDSAVQTPIGRAFVEFFINGDRGFARSERTKA